MVDFDSEKNWNLKQFYLSNVMVLILIMIL
jgi:hypothetical protein